MRGMAGGFMGGALGSMLFGGMGGGMGGSGIGLFQILLFGGIAYFIYTRFIRRQGPNFTRPEPQEPFMTGSSQYGSNQMFSPEDNSDAAGIAMIQGSDPSFSPEQFKETAQDVFFQVQAGWMRRDISSYRHLLGSQLAKQYEEQLEEMHQKGQINKLENIAVRSVEIVDAGVEGNEEFVVISFKANLLDYTVDENSNEVVEGSMTDPVKFAERWSFARPIGRRNWLLEGIELA